jgi:hypothetical protein
MIDGECRLSGMVIMMIWYAPQQPSQTPKPDPNEKKIEEKLK